MRFMNLTCNSTDISPTLQIYIYSNGFASFNDRNSVICLRGVTRIVKRRRENILSSIPHEKQSCFSSLVMRKVPLTKGKQALSKGTVHLRARFLSGMIGGCQEQRILSNRHIFILERTQRVPTYICKHP